MKALLVILLVISPSLSWGNVLVGKWVYDPERIISELKANPKTPDKILKCFKAKLCGYNITFECTENKWRQITNFGDDRNIISEYSDYQVLEETPEKITINAVIEGVDTNVTYSILNANYLSTSMEYEGFKWFEYLKRVN